MALIIPPGFLQAVFSWQLAGDSEVMVNTIGFEESVDNPTPDEAANALFGAFFGAWLPGRPSSYSGVSCTTYYGVGGLPPIVGESNEPPQNGEGSTSSVLPSNCAALVRKRTSTGGRRGRGRIYVPGIYESGVDELGFLTESYAGQLVEQVEDMVANFATIADFAPWRPMILHRSEGAGTEPPPTAITQWVLDGQIATQRRRMRR